MNTNPTSTTSTSTFHTLAAYGYPDLFIEIVRHPVGSTPGEVVLRTRAEVRDLTDAGWIDPRFGDGIEYRQWALDRLRDQGARYTGDPERRRFVVAAWEGMAEVTRRGTPGVDRTEDERTARLAILTEVLLDVLAEFRHGGAA